jgi:hypothetical protein
MRYAIILRLTTSMYYRSEYTVATVANRQSAKRIADSIGAYVVDQLTKEVI